MCTLDYECEDCIGMSEHGCYCKAVGAVAPGGPISPDAYDRIVDCSRCQGEGRLFSGHPNDPNPIDCRRCPACEGTGREAISTEPVELEDLASLSAGQPSRGER